MLEKEILERLGRIEEHLDIASTTTRILVIQDASYSMHSRRASTISGFNEYLEDLQKDKSDNAYLTLIQFDTTYSVVHEDLPVADVAPLNEDTYTLGGGTALLDAVGRGLIDLEKRMNSTDRALVVVMTDGEENSSNQYSQSKIKQMISRLEEKGNYTFIFMGAGTAAWTGGEMLGLRRNQTVYYGEGAHTHGIAYAGLSNMTHSLRGGTAMSNENSGTVTSAAIADLGGEVEQESSATPLWTPDEEKGKEEDKSGE